VTTWLRRYPLAIFLPLQAFVGFFHLGLLSPWMDEAGTLMALRHPLRDVIAFAASDVHPPLYYLLLDAWLQLPLGLGEAVQARALSVIFALFATVALDRLWARYLPDRLRIWLLLLWSLSPCLLLYSRMCRSYSLQTFLVVTGGAFLLQFAGKTTTWRHGAAFILAALGTLYTHYVPGIALLGAVNLLLAGRRLWGRLLVVDVVVACGYTPWIWRLTASLSLWGGHHATYLATGNTLLELPLKLAYWGISFTMGEAVPDAILLLGGATLAVALYLVWDGARQYPRTAALTTILSLGGLIGVARWVSYPFVPARMLFVLPFFLLLLVAGAGTHRRAGNFVLGAMLLLSISGMWCYFHKTGFRNKEYPMPLHQIADYIRQQSTDQNSVILVDSANSDPVGMEYALDSSRPILHTTDPDATRALNSRLADQRVRTVWFLRNTHEVVPDAPNTRFEADLRKSMRPTVFYYQPFSIFERAMMHSMGMPNPPWYAQELLEFRR
jgi:hypothetical protein